MIDRLEEITGPGTVELEREESLAEVSVVEAGPVGVRVNHIVVKAHEACDLRERVERVARRLRSLPEPVVPVEVDPELGGAVLRTSPEALSGDGFFEIEMDTRRSTVRRVRLERGHRKPTDFALTREQLGRLLQELV